jgi:hypothetical protein
LATFFLGTNNVIADLSVSGSSGISRTGIEADLIAFVATGCGLFTAGIVTGDTFRIGANVIFSAGAAGAGFAFAFGAVAGGVAGLAGAGLVTGFPTGLAAGAGVLPVGFPVSGFFVSAG